MKRRYILYQRGQTFYCEDTSNRKQTSLRTKERAVTFFKSTGPTAPSLCA
jgi:hypothetical protein